METTDKMWRVSFENGFGDEAAVLVFAPDEKTATEIARNAISRDDDARFLGLDRCDADVKPHTMVSDRVIATSVFAHETDGGHGLAF